MGANSIELTAAWILYFTTQQPTVTLKPFSSSKIGKNRPETKEDYILGN